MAVKLQDTAQWAVIILAIGAFVQFFSIHGEDIKEIRSELVRLDVETEGLNVTAFSHEIKNIQTDLQHLNKNLPLTQYREDLQNLLSRVEGLENKMNDSAPTKPIDVENVARFLYSEYKEELRGPQGKRGAIGPQGKGGLQGESGVVDYSRVPASLTNLSPLEMDILLNNIIANSRIKKILQQHQEMATVDSSITTVKKQAVEQENTQKPELTEFALGVRVTLKSCTGQSSTVSCLFFINSKDEDKRITITRDSTLYDQNGNKYSADYAAIANTGKELSRRVGTSVHGDLVRGVNIKTTLQFNEFESSATTISKVAIYAYIYTQKGTQGKHSFEFRDIAINND